MWWLRGLERTTCVCVLSSPITDAFQGQLFPKLAEEVGELPTKHRRLVAVFELAPAEEGFVGVSGGREGSYALDSSASPSARGGVPCRAAHGYAHASARTRSA